MGGFISNLFGWSTTPVRTLMLGLDAAGKTTILYKMKLGEVVQSIPTVGFNVEEVKYGKLEFQVWDVGGQDRIRKLWRHYYQGTEALVWVVDSNDTTRMAEAREELHALLKDPALDRAVVLVYANKQDLPNALSLTKVAEALNMHSLKGRKWQIQSCVATTGDGLVEGMEWLSKAVKANAQAK